MQPLGFSLNRSRNILSDAPERDVAGAAPTYRLPLSRLSKIAEKRQRIRAEVDVLLPVAGQDENCNIELEPKPKAEFARSR